MSRWIKIRIIIGVIVSIFIVLVIILLINISYFVNNRYEQQSKEQVDGKKVVLDIEDNIAEIVRQTALKDNMWNDLPLSKTFKKKYNSKDGILVNDNYTKLTWSLSGTDTQQQIVTLIVFHNSKKEYYYVHYTLNENNELDDVEIVDKKLLYDESGNKVIYKESITEENYEDILIKLADPYNINHAEPETDFFNLTENYMNKWSGGFVDNRGFDYYSRYIIKELSSFKKRIVYMKCEYPKFDKNGDIIDIDEELTLYYKVKFFMNTDLWLDDVEVEEVSKKEVDRLLNEKKP